ncbi:hypothetical protein J6590_094735 [Homalodisca vitripennis]|nr:hypothetical protein J6590_085140 [Homalodisca vitripennis]KAG8324340.1 hypothetical protein J6590_094735 [Homalodisca vitripennis]
MRASIAKFIAISNNVRSKRAHCHPAAPASLTYHIMRASLAQPTAIYIVNLRLIVISITRLPVLEGEVSHIEIPRLSPTLGITVVGGSDTALVRYTTITYLLIVL